MNLGFFLNVKNPKFLYLIFFSLVPCIYTFARRWQLAFCVLCTESHEEELAQDLLFVNAVLVSRSRKAFTTRGTRINMPPLLCECHNLDSMTGKLFTFFLKSL